MDVITLFEDRQKKISLTKEQENDLLSFKEILGEQNISIQVDGTVRISHYVGFISKGNTKVQILPKIYEQVLENSVLEQSEALAVFINLLKVSEYDGIKLLPDQCAGITQMDLFEFFVGIFSDKIISVYSKQIHREYVGIEENSTFIKGKINFSENFKKNPFRKDKHIIQYEMFEQDNLINNSIKTVAQHLITITENFGNKNKLKKALFFLDEATCIPLSKEILNTVKHNRINEPFYTVFQLAKVLFLKETPNLSNGKSSVVSFLIPLNKLFEFYLFKVLNGMGENSHAQYQYGKTFACDTFGETFSKVCPDILLFQDNNLTMIIDAKYKNPLNEFKGVSQEDMYQVFSYARIYGVKKVALVYPLFEGEILVKEKKILIKDFSGDIELVLLCIDIKKTSIDDLRNQLKLIFL